MGKVRNCGIAHDDAVSVLGIRDDRCAHRQRMAVHAIVVRQHIDLHIHVLVRRHDVVPGHGISRRWLHGDGDRGDVAPVHGIARLVNANVHAVEIELGLVFHHGRSVLRDDGAYAVTARELERGDGEVVPLLGDGVVVEGVHDDVGILGRGRAIVLGDGVEILARRRAGGRGRRGQFSRGWRGFGRRCSRGIRSHLRGLIGGLIGGLRRGTIPHEYPDGRLPALRRIHDPLSRILVLPNDARVVPALIAPPVIDIGLVANDLVALDATYAICALVTRDDAPYLEGQILEIYVVVDYVLGDLAIGAGLHTVVLGDGYVARYGCRGFLVDGADGHVGWEGDGGLAGDDHGWRCGNDNGHGRGIRCGLRGVDLDDHRGKCGVRGRRGSRIGSRIRRGTDRIRRNVVLVVMIGRARRHGLLQRNNLHAEIDGIAPTAILNLGTRSDRIARIIVLDIPEGAAELELDRASCIVVGIDVAFLIVRAGHRKLFGEYDWRDDFAAVDDAHVVTAVVVLVGDARSFVEAVVGGRQGLGDALLAVDGGEVGEEGGGVLAFAGVGEYRKVPVALPKLALELQILDLQPPSLDTRRRSLHADLGPKLLLAALGGVARQRSGRTGVLKQLIQTGTGGEAVGCGLVGREGISEDGLVGVVDLAGGNEGRSGCRGEDRGHGGSVYERHCNGALYLSG
mmetsp:Transcript_2731/g.6852  ORF Transcript_2731/g.6852 Transcript_2731/m.6852 type:complete len:682 (-) Transcript_2731:364-2409(-)